MCLYCPRKVKNDLGSSTFPSGIRAPSGDTLKHKLYGTSLQMMTSSLFDVRFAEDWSWKQSLHYEICSTFTEHTIFLHFQKHLEIIAGQKRASEFLFHTEFLSCFWWAWKQVPKILFSLQCDINLINWETFNWTKKWNAMEYSLFLKSLFYLDFLIADTDSKKFFSLLG